MSQTFSKSFLNYYDFTYLRIMSSVLRCYSVNFDPDEYFLFCVVFIIFIENQIEIGIESYFPKMYH